MDYMITHHGVPIGIVELPREGERFTVAVRPLPAYQALSALVRAASIALANVALNQPADAMALARASSQGRALELRDRAGALVPADFIELTEWPGGTPEVAAFIRLRDAHAPVPALVPRRGDAGSGAVTPAA